MNLLDFLPFYGTPTAMLRTTTDADLSFSEKVAAVSVIGGASAGSTIIFGETVGWSHGTITAVSSGVLPVVAVTLVSSALESILIDQVVQTKSVPTVDKIRFLQGTGY